MGSGGRKGYQVKNIIKTKQKQKRKKINAWDPKQEPPCSEAMGGFILRDMLVRRKHIAL